MAERHASAPRLMRPVCAVDLAQYGRAALPRSTPPPTDRQLRDAFGSFATGVTVVTCLGPAGGAFGVTVSSFTPVSLDPPLVLVCMKRSGRSGWAIANAGCFAINILQQGQQEDAVIFSRNLRDADEPKWSATDSGVPVLEQSLGILECVVDQVHEAGDHDIIIGRVLLVDSKQQVEPLVHYRGQYKSLSDQNAVQQQQG